jgi:hypothetical protein
MRIVRSRRTRILRRVVVYVVRSTGRFRGLLRVDILTDGRKALLIAYARGMHAK